MSIARRQFIQASAATGLLASLGLQNAHAQALEQVKIVNGFPAGGSADVTSRRIGEKLGGSAYTKNAAVVENKSVMAPDSVAIFTEFHSHSSTGSSGITIAPSGPA